MNGRTLVARVVAWVALSLLAGCGDDDAGTAPAGAPPVFTDLAAGLTGVRYCSLAWGDADSDGDLDLAVAGGTGADCVTTVYENDGPLPNAPPRAPTGLAAYADDGDVLFMWDEAFDAETPAEGLSYALRVGRPPEGAGVTVTPEHADPATGRRMIAAPGPVPRNPSYSWWWVSLPKGVYWFSVQAIDSGLAGGPWSEPVLFAVP